MTTPSEETRPRSRGTNGGWVRYLQLSPPSLADNTADAQRILRALERDLGGCSVTAPLSLVRGLPVVLRESGFRIRCTVFPEASRCVLLEVEPWDAPPLLGLAVDLGTTRVVVRLVDLESAQVLGERAFDNPQQRIGPDILARIHFADTPGGLHTLHHLIMEELNREIGTLSGQAAMSPERIVGVSVAGNTAMTHLFLGLDPHWMIREPYIPVVNTPGAVSARELGLKLHPQARIFVFPNAGSYFGGDLVAGIYYSGLHLGKETRILVDVGTNAEVVLGNSDFFVACAGAAGPALEGGVTRMGTLAGPGVIERVRIDPQTRTLHLQTIGGLPPVGICGSGLIDLAAVLFRSGMLDVQGKFVPGMCGSRLTDRDGIPSLLLVPAAESGTGEDLYVTQVDMDSLLRSKAAMYTILTTITSTVGLAFQDLDRFFVAGTFGAFIDPASAITIGMIPDLPLERYRSLGNSSLEGAALFLHSLEAVGIIEAIQRKITYLELNVNHEFMTRFSAAKFFPHTDPSLFPSVAKWMKERG